MCSQRAEDGPHGALVSLEHRLGFLQRLNLQFVKCISILMQLTEKSSKCQLLCQL